MGALEYQVGMPGGCFFWRGSIWRSYLEKDLGWGMVAPCQCEMSWPGQPKCTTKAENSDTETRDIWITVYPAMLGERFGSPGMMYFPTKWGAFTNPRWFKLWPFLIVLVGGHSYVIHPQVAPLDPWKIKILAWNSKQPLFNGCLVKQPFFM